MLRVKTYNLKLTTLKIELSFQSTIELIQKEFLFKLKCLNESPFFPKFLTYQYADQFKASTSSPGNPQAFNRRPCPGWGI